MAVFNFAFNFATSASVAPTAVTALPEVATVKTFDSWMQDLKANSCPYPPEKWYNNEGVILKPCKIDVPPNGLTNSTQKVDFQKDLCQTIVKFSTAWCSKHKDDAENLLSHDLVVVAADYTVQGVCMYVSALSENISPWLPAFMKNSTSCSNVCSGDFEIVCQGFVSTLCRFMDQGQCRGNTLNSS